MSKVAYLLGAGASFGCVPIVKGMATELEQLEGTLRGYRHEIVQSGPVEKMMELEDVMGILSNLRHVCENHSSIDTYAKKLYLTDKVLFRQLKLDLCLFFSIIQAIKPPDKRYDNFFSSLLDRYGNLPDSVKVISWNYDMQLELSYSDFCNDSLLEYSSERLNLISAQHESNHNSAQVEFSVLKLNGTARSRMRNSNYSYLLEKKSDDKLISVMHIVGQYNKIIKGIYGCDLQFAWENEGDLSFLEKYSNELKDIETLVVIGYSFPYFNRKIDRKIIELLVNLKKIYIQDLNPQGIKESLVEILPFREQPWPIALKQNVDQFVFPRELDDY